MDNTKKLKPKYIVIIVLLAVLCVIVLICILRSDAVVFRKLNRQIGDVSHSEYIEKVSVNPGSHGQDTEINIECINGITDEKLDVLAYELMVIINEHIYVGMTQYSQTRLNTAKIYLRIRAFENDGETYLGRQYDRTVIDDGDGTIYSHFRWNPLEVVWDRSGVFGKIDVPYPHELPVYR